MLLHYLVVKFFRYVVVPKLLTIVAVAILDSAAKAVTDGWNITAGVAVRPTVNINVNDKEDIREPENSYNNESTSYTSGDWDDNTSSWDSNSSSDSSSSWDSSSDSSSSSNSNSSDW